MSRKRELKRIPDNPQTSPGDILTDDVRQHIGFKLSAADRIRFRAVCKAWMSLIPSRHPPWLMLAESADADEVHPEVDVDPSPLRAPPRRGFVSLGEQEIYPIDFPEIHGARCFGSTGNWLITAHGDKSMRLLNPFSRRHIDLPSKVGAGYYRFTSMLSKMYSPKVILSSPPSPNGRGDWIAVATRIDRGTLAIARLGDAEWTPVRVPNPLPPFGVEDAVFYKGKIYAITTYGGLLACDVGDGWIPPTASYLTASSEENGNCLRINYLVEWLDELLLVQKFVETTDETYRTKIFKVYRFDFVNRKWDELKSLGEHSLFLGYNASVSVRALDYFGLVKRNCIYFTDDFSLGYKNLRHLIDMDMAGGHDMGVFDLEDDSIIPHFRGISTSFYSPPLWMVPT